MMTPYFLLLLAAAAAAASPDSAAPSSPEIAASFRPSVAIIVGIFAIMFTLTLLLLIYAKFCHASTAELFGPGMYPAGGGDGGGGAAAARFSGIDKTVIESLPFFPFSSLGGSREGLECAVCLSRFEDAEILRLLPRCKHAFHISCVDRWLEAHSSCPLCRRKVDGGGADSLSSSSRYLSSRRLDTELFVEREPSGRHGSFREEKGRDGVVLLAEEDGPLPPDRFKHRIIVSDVAFRSRWSDVNSSDIMSLRSDMIYALSSRRLGYQSSPETTTAVAGGGGKRVIEIREEMEKNRELEGKARLMSWVDSGEHSGGGASVAFGGRCMSEMPNVSRFRESNGSSEDKKVRRVWLPIARRTVRWIAGKERRSPPAAVAAAWPRGDERG